MNKSLKSLFYLIIFGMGAFLALPAFAVGQLQVSSKDGVDTLQLDMGPGQPPKVMMMQNPPRLIIEIPLLPTRNKVTMPKVYRGKYIKSVRSLDFDSDTSRVIFTLAKPVVVQSAVNRVIGKSKQTLVVTLLATKAAEKAPKNSTAKVTSKPAAAAKAAAPAKVAAPAAVRKPPAVPAAAKGAFSPPPSTNKRTKGLKPLIAIDAGHGGIDPGTKGASGVFEKDIVLGYAEALEKEILKGGKYRVLLTRGDDRFIHLRERVAIARKAGASLFISLHADSAPEADLRGLSIYTVSEEASDKESAALAAQENKADTIGGVDLATEKDDVANILISLAQRDTRHESAILANMLVRSLLDQKLKLLENTHRFAGFAVLKAPDVPSVLVEVGFLSNPEEETLVKSKLHRIRVAAGIAKGIDGYLSKRKVDQ